MVQHARYLARAASAVIATFFFSLSRALNSPLKRVSAVYRRCTSRYRLMLPISYKSERRKNLIYEHSHEYYFPYSARAFCFALHSDFFYLIELRKELFLLKEREICVLISCNRYFGIPFGISFRVFSLLFSFLLLISKNSETQIYS